jgi:hypothetical protein
MRLESAIRTAMAAGADKVIRARAPIGAGFEERFDLRGESGGTQGNMSLYSEEAFKSGKWVAVLWKNFDEPDWDRETSGCLRAECRLARICCAASSRVLSRGCDVANMQVYFCG